MKKTYISPTVSVLTFLANDTVICMSPRQNKAVITDWTLHDDDSEDDSIWGDEPENDLDKPLF